MADVAEFERAVLVAFQYAGASAADQQAQTLKLQAERFCAAVKARADGWRAELQLFALSQHEQVKFYALQALQEALAGGVADDVAVAARAELLAWLQSHAAYVESKAPYLKTKLAVVVTLLIKRDFPDRWPSAFAELLALLPQGAAIVEMYFRILQAINEEIVEFDAQRTQQEAARNMRIKDAMREGACMRESFDAIARVLVNAEGSDVMRVLSASALETLKRYISWVDIGLVVNDTLWPLLLKLLTESETFRCQAANCVFEVIDKGMTPEKKLAMLQQLQILEMLAALPIREDDEFAEEIGEVINAVGLELVTCMDAFRHTNRADLLQASGAMLCQLMPLVWELFAHESKDVSEEVFEIVNAVGGAMLRTETQAAGKPQNEAEVFRPSEYVPQILHGIYRQTRFPEDSDSDAAEFEEYRRSLYTIFLNIVRQRPHDTLAFLTNLAQSLPGQFAEIDPRNLESFLSLVHRFKEGLAPLKAVAIPFNEPTSPLTLMVVQIHSSMLSASSSGAPLHPSVLLTYYDMSVRYSKVLQNESALIPAVLQMMFGPHGLANPAAHVRSRVCYLCLRLVKAIGASVNPHASSILTALQPRLAIAAVREEVASKQNPTSYLAYDDQLYLFELAGQIIASLVLPAEETGMNAKELRYRYTIAVLDPLLQGLNTTLSEMANGALTDQEYVIEHCASHLNAIAHVLKAFKGTDCMVNHQETFTQVLTAAAFVLRALPGSQRVRSKVIFTLHRLTTVLDREHFLNNVQEPLQTLMMGCEQPEVVEIVQLLDQLIIKHKQALGGFLDKTTLPFVQHLCALMPERSALANGETKDAPQLEREATQKYLFTFLLHLVTHGLDAVLISAQNVAQLENMLRLVLEGCSEVQDSNINRACFSIGSMLVERWIGNGAAQSPASDAAGAATAATSAASVALRAELHAELSAEGKARFTQIVVQDFTRAMFAVTKLRHFDVDDMQTMLAVKEIVNMQAVLVGALGVEYLTFMRDVFLPSLGCPPELAGSYTEQVATGDRKKIQAAYKALVSKIAVQPSHHSSICWGLVTCRAMDEKDSSFVEVPATPRAKRPETLSQQANPLATASLPSIILAQWIQPMVSLGAHRVLEKDDVWPICTRDACASLEQRFRRVYDPNRRHAFNLSPLAAAYARTFQVELAFVLVSCVLYVVALALQSYVAQAILQFLNDEQNLFHISSGYWLMAMMTLSSLVAVCALNYAFFSASRIGANMRSLTMSLVFDKALKLSSAARQDYTTGEVLTLMSVDTERVFLLMIQGPWLFMGPLSFIISVVLIGILFDFYSALGAAAVLVVVMAISARQGRLIAGFQKKLLKVIDERVKVTSEALQGIRVMKLYAWEESLAQRVEKLRAKEVGLLRKFHMYQVVNTVMLFLTPSFVSGVTLGIYVLIHHTITVVEAFTLVAMVNICRTALNQLPQAIAGISKAKISYARLDAFLTSDEVAAQPFLLADHETTAPTSKSPLLGNSKEIQGAAIGRGCISIRDASFEWPSTSQTEVIVVTSERSESATAVKIEPEASNAESPAKKTATGNLAFKLEGVNLEVERGSLVMIVGKVGSGKSSLLNAILGEMSRTSGILEIGGRVSYVSQDTWIRNATLRDNILFEEPYNSERYAQVLDASQLAMDLKSLPNGDSTEIGERGINLSGGQKARVAIARAIYRSGTDVLILDDPLSAVDPHVAHSIFDKCITGLAAGQTRLLVVNSHYDLLARADQVIVMHDGAIIGHDSYENVLARFPHFALEGNNGSSGHPGDHGDKGMDAVHPNIENVSESVQSEDAVDEVNDEAAKASAGRLIRTEDRVRGTVGSHVYKAYFDETGINGWMVVLVISIMYCVGQAARTTVDWWPGHWARNMHRRGVDPTYSGTTFGMWYLGLIVLCSILTLIRGVTMIEACMRSSQYMHDELFRRVLRAPVTRYFDVTPIGQILNRFSNDLDQMDTTLPLEYQLFFQNVSMALGSLVVSAFASYWIGVSYIPLLVIFVMTGQYFKKTSRELKRLEGITRTPVYNLFSETLSGLPTIRAFRMEEQFSARNRQVVDTNANMYLTYWSASRWLATRLDLMSSAYYSSARSSVRKTVVRESLSWLSQILPTSRHTRGLLKVQCALKASASATDPNSRSCSRESTWTSPPEKKSASADAPAPASPRSWSRSSASATSTKAACSSTTWTSRA
ncbi:unnamed protein product [Phytophthora fragariaefolia]|uniref:Unnamed protein product n=1 Tax=Phytophthora fragariaefolia TaxID=1490495 RepID=A0A9W6YFS0_9STRA|nr:unnamed protein product [Phytophthora fragariaefolia]